MVMLDNRVLETLKDPFEKVVVRGYELKSYDITIVPVGKFRPNLNYHLRFNPNEISIFDLEKETTPVAVSVHNIIKTMVFPPRLSVLETISKTTGKEIESKDLDNDAKLLGINLVSKIKFLRHVKHYLDLSFLGDYKDPGAYTGIVDCSAGQLPIINAFLFPPTIGYKLLKPLPKT